MTCLASLKILNWASSSREVKKPAALGAGNNGFVGAQCQAGLGSDFHVATRADIVLNGNDGARIFGFE